MGRLGSRMPGAITLGRVNPPDRPFAADRVLGWMARTLPAREYVVSHLDALPDGFVQQHVLRATLPNGATWELPACVIVRVRDGQIVRLDEYLDSAHVARLTEALTRG